MVFFFFLQPDGSENIFLGLPGRSFVVVEERPKDSARVTISPDSLDLQFLTQPGL